MGAHSDVGGAYWYTKEELTTLHFFDLGVDADVAEKQKLEQQKELLRNWYISQKLCLDDQSKFYWETKHHVHAFEGMGSDADGEKEELLPENFMGNAIQKTVGNWTYLLKGYHHKLVSKRPLNNKLSLVYMNVMKYIASTYADVPFLEPNDKKLNPPPYRLEEYVYPKGDNNEKDLAKYQDLLVQAAEHGWVNKEGKVVTYPKLVNEKGYYSLSSEMYDYIMGNFVHLSANFNAPLADVLDHFNIAYANAPHFTDEKEFKDPPYKREAYTPILDAYDKP